MILCLAWSLMAHAQPLVVTPEPVAYDARMPRPQVPSDVLTPDTRRNTPSLKIALFAALNRSNYSNDRYLDNTQLDVGEVSGEGDIYETSAGFGYSAGIGVEYPQSTGLSYCFTGEYLHVRFGGRGPVHEPCIDPSGDRGMATSQHEFAATIDYVKLAATAKLNFSSFHLMLGLTAAYPFSSTLERTRSLSGSNCTFPNSGGLQTIVEAGEIPDPSSLHYALRTGFGLTYQIHDRLQFSPELTLDFGMNSINKSRESDLGVYSIRAVLRYDL